MAVQTVRLPQFSLAALNESEVPQVMTDSAAERAWVPAYNAQLTPATAA
ncbi:MULTISPECIES: hypothetical protein [unclassified Streptomyces]|nr:MULTISPECIES: hypothetical protein [unclassified Streptomyces]WSR29140.1 hypothetical protein OG573_41895 [Streptomyces sp. NBC_01205]